MELVITVKQGEQLLECINQVLHRAPRPITDVEYRDIVELKNIIYAYVNNSCQQRDELVEWIRANKDICTVNPSEVLQVTKTNQQVYRVTRQTGDKLNEHTRYGPATSFGISLTYEFFKHEIDRSN
jgi:hypothetical protein